MKSMKSALLGASFLIGVGALTAANAADVYHKGSFKDEPVYAPGVNWTGAYVGAHVGSTLDDTFEAEGQSEDADESLLAGLHLGYNWQTHGRWVLGVEGDISWVDDSEVESVKTTDYLASLRGRAGYAFDRSLLYATAGVAFLGWDDEVSDDLEDDTSVGFVVGAGFEHKLRENVSFGLEGLYYDFDDAEIRDGGPDLERDLWTIRARLSYHFASDRDAPLK